MPTRTRFAVLFLGCVAMLGCAGTARLLGIETQAETDAKVVAIKATGSLFGPYGELVGGLVAAGLIAINNARRNKTRANALTNLATGVAGAFGSSQSPAKVAEILTESLPGKAEVMPVAVAQMVADAKVTTVETKAEAKPQKT